MYLTRQIDPIAFDGHVLALRERGKHAIANMIESGHTRLHVPDPPAPPKPAASKVDLGSAYAARIDRPVTATAPRTWPAPETAPRVESAGQRLEAAQRQREGGEGLGALFARRTERR